MNHDVDQSTGTGELVILQGPGRGAVLPFPGPVVLLGRSPDCDHRFDDLTVRPNHCIVSRSTAGLYLRALGGDCLVNGLHTMSRELLDGDVLQLGDTAIEVVFTRPLPLEPQPAERRNAPWREQLARARARLLRERRALRADYGRHLASLTAARRDVEEQRSATAAQRERLRDLRRRFIRRWKQHWSMERSRFEAERARLLGELESARRERDGQHADLAEQRRQLDQRETTLAHREQAINRREQQATEELQRLEERIRQARLAIPADPIVPIASLDVPDVPELAQRRQLLEHAEKTLADQRQVLLEQASLWARIAADVRQEAIDVADALAALIHEHSRVEAHIDRELGRLDARHAELVVLSGELDRRELEVAGREQTMRRRESTLNRLANRWQQQRARASERMRADLETVRLMRLRAEGPGSTEEELALAEVARKTTERLALIARLEQELTDREIDLERQQALPRLQADADAVSQFQRKAALAQAEKQIIDLRAEVDRLVAALNRSGNPPHRRAA